jgi:hypothetical protein
MIVECILSRADKYRLLYFVCSPNGYFSSVLSFFLWADFNYYYPRVTQTTDVGVTDVSI